MATFEKFAAAHGITLQSKFLGVGPLNGYKDDKHAMYKWSCTLANGAARMTTTYSAGAGHASVFDSAGQAGIVLRREKRLGAPVLRATPELLRGVGARSISVHDVEHKVLVPRAPQVADLLQCLAGDAQSGAVGSFEAFCSDCDYDTDSRRAEAVYRACQKTNCELQALLGATLFAELMSCTEDEEA